MIDDFLSNREELIKEEFIDEQFLATHSKEDLCKLNLWKEREYNDGINTWTIRDPLKRETAKNNHLNWLEFFNMKEFTEWLSKQ